MKQNLQSIQPVIMWKIARDEWRYWFRSKLAVVALLIGLTCTMLTVVVSVGDAFELEHQRGHAQQQSEQTFVNQPDRHPHRMVHYGHYVFKTPPPLGMVDPGVDSHTGNTIFLEGHRQNSATFADQKQSSGTTILGALTPAFVLQVLAPLLLVIMGYGVVSRERETQTLSILAAQGLGYGNLILGKISALLLVAMLMLLPLAISGIVVLSQGESLLTLSLFLVGYLLYLSIWILIIVSISLWAKSNSVSFSTLAFTWLVLCILMPRVATTVAGVMVPAAGKLEKDFAVVAELRQLGDGHNAKDKAFVQLEAELLKKHKVNRVEDLPLNFRGFVALKSEAEITSILNRYAEDRMHEELRQSFFARQFGWLSPQVALRTLSMLTAGTGLETHHRFLCETENLRFNFVQRLNQAHTNKLNYIDDMNRNKSEAAGQIARISAKNWNVIEGFKFRSSPSKERALQAMTPLAQLLLWFGMFGLFLRNLQRHYS